MHQRTIAQHTDGKTLTGPPVVVEDVPGIYDELRSHPEFRRIDPVEAVMVGEYNNTVTPGRCISHIHEGVRELPYVRVMAPDGIAFILGELNELERRALAGITDVALVGCAEDADNRAF